jgi:hypothetical protein
LVAEPAQKPPALSFLVVQQSAGVYAPQQSWEARMPRFYFDYRQGEDRIMDTQGVDLATTEAAYLEVCEAAQEMWGDLLKKRCDPRRCQFEVRDANRELMFVFPFQEVIDNCLDREPARRASGVDRATVTAAATAGRVVRANDEFLSTLREVRATLRHSRALLATKI